IFNRIRQSGIAPKWLPEHPIIGARFMGVLFAYCVNKAPRVYESHLATCIHSGNHPFRGVARSIGATKYRSVPTFEASDMLTPHKRPPIPRARHVWCNDLHRSRALFRKEI